GVRVEPGGGGSVFEARRCALDGVGPWPECVVVPCVAALENIEGPATGHGDDTAHGPAAEDQALGPLPGLREGNLPNVAQHEAVALIIDTGGAFGLAAVARILADAAAGVDRLSSIVNSFRPRVGSGQAQT